MNFKEKIRLHNKGQGNLVGELISLSLSPDCVITTMVSTEVTQKFYNEEDGYYTLTFKRWRPEYKPKYDTFEYRLAHNFRTILTRHAKPANSARSKRLFEIDNHYIHENDGLGFIYETLEAVGAGRYKDDFDHVTEKTLDDVAEKFGVDHFLDFHDELKEFQGILPYINKKKQKYYDEISPLMIDALNEMLLKVDLDRSDNDIVAYIAKGVRHGTYRRLNELYGVHTFDIGGEKYYVKEIDMKFCGVEKLIGNRKEKPTKSQKDFIKKLSNLISEEFEKRNVKAFTFDKVGTVFDFNKRYFASRMGLKESAFKHRLRRLQKEK